MTEDEYYIRQTAIVAATAAYMAQVAQLYLAIPLTAAHWLGFLRVIFPQVQAASSASAKLGRELYDSLREDVFPGLPRQDQELVSLDFEEFALDMQPVKRQISRKDADQRAVTALQLRTSREVMNAGRQQIIQAVKQDKPLLERVEEAKKRDPDLYRVEAPKPVVSATEKVKEVSPRHLHAVDDGERIVRGWARQATGRETCAWCLMLISRGPVYLSASSAGLDLDDLTATRMVAAGEDVSDYMEKWHDGCDCLVIPVFKVDEWSGKDAWKRAQEMWDDAAEAAYKTYDEDDLVYYAGANKGRKVTYNDSVINTLRRRLERGDISILDIAAFAA